MPWGGTRSPCPSAHVYASIRVSIYGTGNTDGDGHETHNAGFAGIRNVETGEVEWIREVGFVWAWYSSSVPGEDHVTSDRKAQAWALAGEGGILHYTKVKLTYKYGRLGLLSDAPIARRSAGGA